jgi:hypothetical protein
MTDAATKLREVIRNGSHIDGSRLPTYMKRIDKSSVAKVF